MYEPMSFKDMYLIEGRDERVKELPGERGKLYVMLNRKNFQ